MRMTAQTVDMVFILIAIGRGQISFEEYAKMSILQGIAAAVWNSIRKVHVS